MTDKDCEHPAKFIKHIRLGLHECLMCGHTAYLKDRPYYCGYCPEVYSLTWDEMRKHMAQCPHQERRKKAG